MRYAVVVVGLAVVLAGCNAPLGPAGTPTPSTPTATPTSGATPTATGTEPPDPADVGVAADGVVDPVALAAAHEARLANRSYVLDRSVTVRGPNGTVPVRNRKVVAVAAGGDRFVWNGTSDVADDAPVWLRNAFGRIPSERAYSNGTTTTVVIVDSGGRRQVVDYAERGVGETPFLGAVRSLTGASAVRRTFSRVETRVTDVRRADGAVRYRLVATDGPHDYVVPRTPDVAVDVVSLEADVERSGLVRRLVLRYTAQHDGARYEVTRTLSVSGVGSTTVERPAWLDDPEPNASGTPAARPAGATP